MLHLNLLLSQPKISTGSLLTATCTILCKPVSNTKMSHHGKYYASKIKASDSKATKLFADFGHVKSKTPLQSSSSAEESGIVKDPTVCLLKLTWIMRIY